MDMKNAIKIIQGLFPKSVLRAKDGNYEVVDKEGDCLFRLPMKVNMTRDFGVEIMMKTVMTFWPQWAIDEIVKNGFDYEAGNGFLKLKIGEKVVYGFEPRLMKNKALVRKMVRGLGSLRKALKL